MTKKYFKNALTTKNSVIKKKKQYKNDKIKIKNKK